MKITADQVKELGGGLGADLCGVASVERFSRAPAGFKPTDIYCEAKSVVVVAKRLSEAAFSSRSPVPYTVPNPLTRSRHLCPYPNQRHLFSAL